MTNSKVFLCRKKSGNYIVSSYVNSAWEIIAECSTPKELKEAVNSLDKFETVIKSEYSQSQLKTNAWMYNEKDALKAFGLSSAKSVIEANF
jgi:hypothetical protein